MHLRATLTLVAFLGMAFAGCVQNDAPLPPEPIPTKVSKLVAYRDGVKVPVPAEFEGLELALRPTGFNGGEPNIGITSKGNLFVTAGHHTLKSENLGLNWTIAFNMTAFWGPLADTPIPNDTPGIGDPVRGVTRSSDPMLWVDTDTDRIFTNHMTGLYCSKMFVSDDEGATWIPSPFDCGIPVNDHQKVATARYGPSAPNPNNPAYPNVVYYCYNKLVSTNCAVSFNGGLSFQYDRPATVALGNTESGAQATAPCGGINGHPAPAPDGTLYVPLNLGCDGPVVLVTTDNGLTWVARQGPTEHGAAEIDPDITVTPDGTAYMLYRGSDHLQYLVRSKDRFVTWEGPWQVSPPGVKSTVFTVITSGDDGRIAMAFLGTKDSDTNPSVANETSRWHLYQVFSLDAAAESPTFTMLQVTPDEDPVQIGCVWLSGGGNPCRNMLDFIDMTSTPDGRPVVVFADGCHKDCAYNATATNEQSRGRLVTVSVLVEGPSLRAESGRFSNA
jgi:hypothetical protein